MIARAMAAAAKADNRHAGDERRLHTSDAVFNDNARLGTVPSFSAAKRKRSGAGLPRATCEALKTCGSNNGNSPVTESAWRTRSRWLFEATQRGPGTAVRSSAMPGIGISSRSKAMSIRARIVSKKPSGRQRPNRLCKAAVRVRPFLPIPRTIASSIVVGKSAAIRHSPRTRPKMISLSIRTPSQSKMTRGGTRGVSPGCFFAGYMAPQSPVCYPALPRSVASAPGPPANLEQHAGFEHETGLRCIGAVWAKDESGGRAVCPDMRELGSRKEDFILIGGRQCNGPSVTSRAIK
jgi:hypothetical protein